MYEHGEGQPTRAVCVDKGLDFTIGEMSGGDLGRLADNRLFRGGDVSSCVRTSTIYNTDLVLYNVMLNNRF